MHQLTEMLHHPDEPTLSAYIDLSIASLVAYLGRKIQVLTCREIENAYVLVLVSRNEEGHGWVRNNAINLRIAGAV